MAQFVDRAAGVSAGIFRVDVLHIQGYISKIMHGCNAICFGKKEKRFHLVLIMLKIILYLQASIGIPLRNHWTINLGSPTGMSRASK